MKKHYRFTVLTAILGLIMWALPRQVAAQTYYDPDVLSIFNDHGCLGCHGASGGLNLNSYSAMLSGGNSGPAIVIGDAASSVLMARISNGSMPPGPNDISAANIAVIEAWINAGAPEMAPAPVCNISGVSASSAVCSGLDASFDVSFTVTDGSGTYNVVDAAGAILGSGSASPISVSIANALGGSVSVDVVDAADGTCMGGALVSVSYPDCTPAPVCNISGVSASSAVCSGLDASFDVSFTVTDGSGTYNVVDAAGAILGSGSASPISVSIANALGGSVSVDVVDAVDGTCMGGALVSVSYPDCTPIPPASTCESLVNGTDLIVDFTGFDGSGFVANPTAGQLSSGVWMLSGLSDGYIASGDNTLGDHTGLTAGDGETGGGMYAYDDGTNQALWVQPTGSDFSPGCVTMAVCNNTGAELNSVSVSYDLLVLNDADRANSFNFSYSEDGIIFMPVAALDYVSDELTTGVLITQIQATTLSGLAVADGATLYLQWCSDDVSGSGSRDEFGLDNINLSTSLPCTVNNVIVGAAVCSGTSATFDVSFAANNGSGVYNVVDETGSILGSGSASPISVDITNALGGALMIDVVDAADVTCAGGTPINITYPNCSVPIIPCESFDGNDLTVDFTGFDGSGVAVNPSAGQLNANYWSFDGFSDPFNPGADNVTGDYANGVTTGAGETGGGVYAYDDGANQALWIQPTGSDFSPGCVTLELCNDSGAAIDGMSVSYDVLVLNDGGRANSFNFAYSEDGVNFNLVAEVDFTSVEPADNALTITTQVAILNGLTIADGTSFYLQWCGADVSGSGSRDEFGLDNITLSLDVPCAITDVTASDAVCNGMNADFEVSFAANNASGTYNVVDVTGAVLATGTTSPIMVNIAGATGTTIEVDVVDATDATCMGGSYVMVALPDCRPCSITGVVANAVCDQADQYDLTVTFEVLNAASTSYSVMVDGAMAGSGFYTGGDATETITIQDLAGGDGIATATVTVMDDTDAACTSATTYVLPDCAIPVCAIDNIQLTPICVTAGGAYDLSISFDAYNTTGSMYTINVNNGEFTSNFPYNPTTATQSLTIPNLSDVSVDVMATVIITDVTDALCSNSMMYSVPSCPVPCSFSNVVASIPVCNGFEASFDVSFEVVSGSGSYSVMDVTGAVLATGVASPISINIASAAGESLDLSLVDDSNADCMALVATVVLPDCSIVPPSCDSFTGMAMYDFTGFDGTGVTAAPTSGQLSSLVWDFSGFSNTYVYGGNNITGDYAHGITMGGESSGGIYAYDDGANQALWIQPTGSDFTPGCAVLQICNNTGSALSEFSIRYDLLVLNDADRANSLNFSYSTDGVDYTDVPALDYTSGEAPDAVPTIMVYNQMATVTGLDVPDGAIVYLSWCGSDVSGSGSRDEFGLDNINISLEPFPVCTISNTSASAAVCNGADAFFEVEFEVMAGSGMYNVMNAAGAVLANGTASPIGITIPNSTGGSVDLWIADAADATCMATIGTLSLPTCIEESLGCTDIAAINYTPTATTDDGSCMYEACTDPNAINYVPSASNIITNNSLCVYNGVGCTAFDVTITSTTDGVDANGSPLQYDGYQIVFTGGVFPFDYDWVREGYVRFNTTINANADGGTIDVIVADGASFNLIISDANGCIVLIEEDSIGGGETFSLDIFTYTITPDNGSGNGSVNISVSGGTLPYSYEWSNGSTSQDINFLTNGWYTVTVTDALGEQTIGWYWVPKQTRGRGKIAAPIAELQAYPNPANTQVNLAITLETSDDEVRVDIVSVSGHLVKAVYNGTLVANQQKTVGVNLNDLASGLYLVQLRTSNGIVQYSKLMVTK